MTPEQIRWLAWGATQHRPSGAQKWDEPGTVTAITSHCGSWGIDVATEHVLAHARDPKARTPAAITRSFTPDTTPQRSLRFPARAGVDECRIHPGEHASGCRACAADSLAGDRPEPRPHEGSEPTPAYLAARAATDQRPTTPTEEHA